MRLPDFLLIGAMKCGTTTLFMDLCAHPGVFMPEDKEPHNLCDDRVLTDTGLREYAGLFAPARADQKCGEASTGYTKLPTRTGVVERARKTLTPDLRLLYIVREPVSRIVSHHFHLYSNNRTGPDIAATIRDDPRLIDYTRYATQIAPWIDAYGPDRVMIIRFESYIESRRAFAERLHGHLGLAPMPEVTPEGRIANKGEGKTVTRGMTGFLRSGLYKRMIRGLAPAGLRRAIRENLMPKAPDRPPPPRPETVEMIQAELGEECERLRGLMGLSGPVWDFEAVRRKYAGGGPERQTTEVDVPKIGAS